MYVFLDTCNGAFWSLAYIAAIILGVRNRTYCVPAFAICMNFSWELLAVLNRFRIGSQFTLPFLIQIIWLVLDLGIIITWQLFRLRDNRVWRKDILCFFGAFFFALLCITVMGWVVAAFFINAVMSVSFVLRLRKRSENWTSLFIAVTKMMGTFAAMLCDGVLNGNAVVLWLGGICAIMDIYYILLLRKEKKRRETLSV